MTKRKSSPLQSEVDVDRQVPSKPLEQILEGVRAGNEQDYQLLSNELWDLMIAIGDRKLRIRGMNGNIEAKEIANEVLRKLIERLRAQKLDWMTCLSDAKKFIRIESKQQISISKRKLRVDKLANINSGNSPETRLEIVPDPHSDLTDVDDADHLQAALDHLPDVTLAEIGKLHLQGKSNIEIAELTNLHPSAIGRRIKKIYRFWQAWQRENET